MQAQPNVIFIFADQWRQQAAGYTGDPNVRTPQLDSLAAESVNFTQAVSGCPVCSPYRASFLTGQRPLTHGVFVNDVYLQPRSVSIAQAFAGAGYDTAYIGKWHVDGHGRSAYIPPERRQGFDYWKVLECTHSYNHSEYYAGDEPRKMVWDSYDANAQTADAQDYIRRHQHRTKPFFLTLSWGPPHDPYQTAPEEFRQLYNPAELVLRPNVPDDFQAQAQEKLAGYYAHCSALDKCLGDILKTVEDAGLTANTVLVFASDHGDMLGSHGELNKQRPWDESIRVPFLLRYPGLPGWQPGTCTAPIDAPDIMPTLLGLCEIPVPESVEGLDFSGHLKGAAMPGDGSALISCIHPFGQWSSGREYRGLRTGRYTYVRDLQGPWLLYDNETDPYQLRNLVAEESSAKLREQLESRLSRKLADCQDEFRPGMDYIRQWQYTVNETGTVPYEN